MITINNVIFVSAEEWKQTLTVILVLYPRKLCSVLLAHLFKYDYKNQGNTQMLGYIRASPGSCDQPKEIRQYLLEPHS